MSRRDGKARDLFAIASAVVGSAAAARVIPAPCCEFHEDVEAIQCCDDCPDELTDEQQENTYAAGNRGQGVWAEDAVTRSVVGSNGRRIIVREDADGLYVGGVLLATSSDVRDVADLLADLAQAMHVREQS